MRNGERCSTAILFFRWAAVVVGTALIFIALALTFIYGMSVGNAISLFTGAVILAAGLWFNKLPRIGKRIILAAGTVLLAFSLAVLTVIIIHGAKDTVRYDEDCVLVLGSGIRGEEILPTLRSRLDKCLEYLEMNPGVPVIVSGGQGSREDIPEAWAMRDYLIRNGISPEQVIVENNSRNTKENFALSKVYMDSVFNDRPGYTVACITSDYHLYRTGLIAAGQGTEARLFGAGVKWYLRPSAYCREVLSVFKYWILG